MMKDFLAYFKNILASPTSAIEQMKDNKTVLLYSLIIYVLYSAASAAVFGSFDLSFALNKPGADPAAKLPVMDLNAVMYVVLFLGPVLTIVQSAVIGLFSQTAKKVPLPVFVLLALGILIVNAYIVSVYSKNSASSAALLFALMILSSVLPWKFVKAGTIDFKNTTSLILAVTAVQLVSLVAIIPVLAAKSAQLYGLVTMIVSVWVLVLVVKGIAAFNGFSAAKAFVIVFISLLYAMLFILAMAKTGIIDAGSAAFLENFYG